MAAGKRENTRTYLTRAIGHGYQMGSRGYSSNGIIKRTTVVGQGDVYSCGEKINRLAASGQFKTDVGTLSDHQVTSSTGQYDSITLVFEELLAPNKDGFAVYTNLRSAVASLPMKFNTDVIDIVSSKYQVTEGYKWYWDHSIYTRTATADAKTVSQSEWDAWAAAGWNETALQYDDIKTGLNTTDLDEQDIIIVPNGKSAPTGYSLAKFASGVKVPTGSSTDVGGKAVQSLLPDTKTYYLPDVTITQTIYCETDEIVQFILEANGKLVAPRKTDRSKYDTYNVRDLDALVNTANKYWLCQVQTVDTQSAISKVVVNYRYRAFGWSTKTYVAYQDGWDAFTNKATAAS